MKAGKWTIRALGPVAALVLAAGALAAPPQDEAAVLRSYYSGNGLLNRGMYELAAAEYRQFLAEHAGHEKAPHARYGLAVALFRTNRFDEAQRELVALRDLDDFGYAADVLMILGQSYLALERPEEALDCFRAVVLDHQAHDHADEAAALWAEALHKSGRHAEVAEPCRLLVARWPQSPLRERAELVWGLADMARGADKEAAQRFGEMAARFPDGSYADQVALLLAQALHRSDSLKLAERQYRAVVNRGRREYVPDALYGLAMLLHGDGRLEAAGEFADRLLSEYPDDELATSARLLRGRIWFDQADYQRARPLFEEVAKRSGDLRDDAVYWHAKCRLRQGAAAEAARALGEAAREFPKSELLPRIVYDEAVALVRAGEPEEALDVLENFRRSFADHELAPGALHLMASTLHQQERYPESLERCDAFIRQYDDHDLAPSVAFLQAENHFLLQDFESARTLYQALLKRHPGHDQAEQARYRLGMSLYRLGAYDQAEQLLEEFARGPQTEADYRQALLAVGDGHFQRENWTEAEAHLSAYLGFGLDQPLADDALVKLGLALERQDRDEEALEAFEQLVGRFTASPHRLHALFERAQVLVALGRTDDAERAFEQVLAAGADSRFAPHALNHLGAIALERKDYREAATYFGRAASEVPGELSPDATAEALFQEGQALMSAQQFEPAERVLRHLIKQAPEHQRIPEATALAAIARARQDADGRALAEINRVESAHGSRLTPALRTSLAYERAWCLRRLKRDEDAAAAYRAVLETPGDVPLRNRATLELAELEVAHERYDPAASRLRELRGVLGAAADTPRDLREHCTYQLGLCEFHLGHSEQAAGLLEEFLSDFPESDLVPSASLLAGEASFRLGRHDRAVGHLGRVVDRYESHESYGPALLRQGEALAALQDWAASEAAFRKYLHRMADARLWFQARFGVGFALENQGRFEEAIEAYRDVVERHEGPTAARAQFQIGECLFALRRFQEAVRELMRVDILYAYPEWSAPALFEAGRCFEELGDPMGARAQYEIVMERYGQTEWAKLAGKRLAALEITRVPGQ